MIFVVDIGNSNITIALMDEHKKVCFTGRVRTTRQKSMEEFMIECKSLMDVYHVTFEGVEGSIISSVVPEITMAISEAIQVMTGTVPMIVGSGIKTGIHIATDSPARLGTDLVVDGVAGCEEHQGPLIIIDMGTATTLSVISANRTYQGTLIMPGVAISQEALTERTSQLPHIRLEKPKHIVGKNTVESMQGGLLYGNAAMVDGLIDLVCEDQETAFTVIATGGIAGMIMPYCKHEIIYDPDLLLKGLWYIYYKNVK